KKFWLILLLLLLLLLGAVAVYFVVKSSDDGGSGGDDDDGNEDNQGIHHITKKKPTAKTPKSRPTKALHTTSPTPDQFKEPPPTPRPERKPRTDDGNILLCTISHRAFHKGLYPQDGLCDLLFYTMAYYEPTSKKILGSYDVFSFEVFRTKVKDTPADSRTQYGVSFEYRRVAG
ncbi:hypothetical protein MTO96_040562, partial [Rhipicephalus appendiculatus]